MCVCVCGSGQVGWWRGTRTRNRSDQVSSRQDEGANTHPTRGGLTEDDTFPITDLSQTLQPSLGRGNVPALSQYGLDDDTRDLVRRDLLLEQEGQVGEGEFGHLVDRGIGGDVQLGSVGERGGVDAGLYTREGRSASIARTETRSSGTCEGSTKVGRVDRLGSWVKA